MNEGIVFEECDLNSEGANENARVPIAGAGCIGAGAGCVGAGAGCVGAGAGCGANCYGVGCGAGC